MLVALPRAAMAQAGGEIEFHGFVLGNIAGRIGEEHPTGEEGGRFLLGEGRLGLEFAWWADAAELSVFVRTDAIYDAVAGELDLDLREGYLLYATGPFDFRVGRQIITWGVGDLLFINDVFPKDWESFFSGRPLEYLKLGVDGLQTHYASALVNLEVVALPRFQPDNLPTAERFFFFDPLAEFPSRVEQRPPMTLGNTEVAVRAYRRLGSIDASGYAYRGFWRTPSPRSNSADALNELFLVYPELSTYGASAQRGLLRGVLSLEFGYYDSRQDRAGSDPTIPNSEVRFLVGYQRQMGDDFTVGMQYYVELMRHFSAYQSSLPEGFPARSRYRDTATLRLTKLLSHQTWTLSLFAFYSPADADYLLQPEIDYRVSDRLSATVGANVFGGREDHTFLGQLDRNDNVYVALRFDF